MLTTDIQDLVSSVQNLYSDFYSTVAVSALLLYDFFIILDKEVELFWKSPFSLVNLCFFLIRYTSLVKGVLNILAASFTIRSFTCTFSLWVGNFTDWTTLLCVDYILFLRVRALYSFEIKHKKVIKCLQALYVLEIIVTFGSLVSLTLKENVRSHSLSNGFRMCEVSRMFIGLRILTWAAVLAYAIIMLCLALYKSMGIRTSLGVRGLQLLKILLADQAIYFSSIIVCGVVNIISDLHTVEETSGFYLVLGTLGTPASLVPVGSRMLIHLKKAAEMRPELGSSFRISSDVSVAEFRTYGRVDESAEETANSSLERHVTSGAGRSYRSAFMSPLETRPSIATP